MWNLTYTYDGLETELGIDLEWAEVAKILRGFKPSESLTQITITRKGRT